MTKPQNKLIITVEKIVHFREYASPLLLRIRYYSEDRFQPLPVELGLVVEIFESKCQLLPLRHSMHRKVEPCLVAILLIRGSIMGDPNIILIFLTSFRDLRHVATAKVTVECYCSFFVLLKFGCYPLRVDLPQFLLSRMS